MTLITQNLYLYVQHLVLGALLICKCLKLKIKCFTLGHMVDGMIFFGVVVVCLSQQGPNILGSPRYPSITSVLTTLESYGTSLDLVLWSVLASGRRWLGVLCMRCVYKDCVVCVAE